MSETDNIVDVELDYWLAVNALGCQPTDEPDDWVDHNRPLVWTRPARGEQPAKVVVGVPWRPQASNHYTHTWYNYSPTTNYEQACRLIERLKPVYPLNCVLTSYPDANGMYAFNLYFAKTIPMAISSGIKDLLVRHNGLSLAMSSTIWMEVETMLGEKAYERYR